MGFIIHVYIIFGTNLLTQRPSPDCCFFACFRVLQKKNIKRSPNGMKPSREIFLEKITHMKLENHVRRSRGCPRGWGARPPSQGAPLPRGPLERPPVPSFFLYKSTYPRNSVNREKTPIPPPYLLFPWRSHLGASSGAPPEGDLSRRPSSSSSLPSP